MLPCDNNKSRISNIIIFRFTRCIIKLTYSGSISFLKTQAESPICLKNCLKLGIGYMSLFRIHYHFSNIILCTLLLIISHYSVIDVNHALFCIFNIISNVSDFFLIYCLHYSGTSDRLDSSTNVCNIANILHLVETTLCLYL